LAATDNGSKNLEKKREKSFAVWAVAVADHRCWLKQRAIPMTFSG
jgi:hypothetical protein